MKNITKMNPGGAGKTLLQKCILAFIHGYNHEKYWKRRGIVIDPRSKVPTLIR